MKDHLVWLLCFKPADANIEVINWSLNWKLCKINYVQFQLSKVSRKTVLARDEQSILLRGSMIKTEYCLFILNVFRPLT